MSACVEFDIPFTIQSAQGDLTLNDTANPTGYFVLDYTGCAMGRDLRVTADPLPQADGENLHRSFTEGYQVKLLIQFWDSQTKMACRNAEQNRAMNEELMLHCNSLLNEPGRIFWSPTGLGDQRLLDEARVVALPRPNNGPAVAYDVTFESPFPYVIDFAQESEALADGVPEYLSNDGNVETYPVVQVQGPTSAFTIWNSTTGEQLEYDAGRPGASSIGAAQYLELDFFRNSAVVHSSVTGLPIARRMAGVVVESSNFWVLPPGVSFVEITGAAATVLWNASNA